jgi:pyruvate/2-oxoglutarate dehydrogenase complex dihydrolipoamide acyltransferase (E2) component
VIDVRIPKLGMSTVEVDVVAVRVAVGDVVEPSTILVEVESEKANFEIEAGHAGVVRELLVAEGDGRNVGDVVARIETTSSQVE